VTNSFDFARVYYWHIQLFEPDDPDDERYVLLHGEEGEVLGPLTVPEAQAWIDRGVCPSRSRGLGVTGP